MKEAVVVKGLVNNYLKNEYLVIYLDEFVTTKNTVPTHDWTPTNATFEIDYKLYHRKTIASIAAISVNGPELIMSFDKSINSNSVVKSVLVTPCVLWLSRRSVALRRAWTATMTAVLSSLQSHTPSRTRQYTRCQRKTTTT